MTEKNQAGKPEHDIHDHSAGVPYQWWLASSQGAGYVLTPVRGFHSPEQVEKAKTKLRNEHDVVTLRVDWEGEKITCRECVKVAPFAEGDLVFWSYTCSCGIWLFWVKSEYPAGPGPEEQCPNCCSNIEHSLLKEEVYGGVLQKAGALEAPEDPPFITRIFS